MTDKIQCFMWACSKLREAVDAGEYGSMTISMQGGLIGNIRTEKTEKPPVDNTAKSK